MPRIGNELDRLKIKLQNSSIRIYEKVKTVVTFAFGLFYSV